MTQQKKPGLETLCGLIAAILAVLGLGLYILGFSTGYYIFGQMQSTLTVILICAAIVLLVFNNIARRKWTDAVWTKVLTFGATALLAAGALYIVGDRVEGIGNCIVTDYDSGHGGEEAIYLSLGGAVLLLIAMVFNIVGAFSKERAADAKPQTVKKIVTSVIAAALAVAVGLTALNLGGVLGSKAGPGGAGLEGTYTISFNQNNNNVENMPGYQFLCSDLSGMLKADSRFFIDEKLELKGGAYTLTSDAYVVEGGKRAEIGDDTGLGLILTTVATGTYTDNGDGTITTSAAEHAVFTMQTDTYSQQMKGAAQMNVGGNDADGEYDSNDEPAVLDFVPETVWTLKGDAIASYHKAGEGGGTYTISYNQNNGNAEDMPTTQFLCSDLSGMVKADSRFFIDLTLELADGAYTLTSDAYVVEGGKRAEIGDDTGLGLILTTVATGTYTDNGDGTITTSAAEHAVFTMQTDTYSQQMKGAAQMNVGGNDADGVYDSNDEPAVLDFVPETVWTLDGSAIVTYEAEGEEEEPTEPSEPAEAQSLIVTSDDGGTTLTFNPDGTYAFDFEAYGIHEEGAWTYEAGTLTVTNGNGDAATADGDPMHLHYVSATSDQLTGDYTIAAADLAALLSGGASNGESLPVTADDGGTVLTFNPDGTYAFDFAAYGIHEEGTWSYEAGTLTVTNGNGDAATADGDPMHLHYVSATSDQLTGDYTIAAADLAAVLGGEAAQGEPVTITSDDGATTLTFNPDGTFTFFFEAYGVEEAGTWSYENGVLTVTNPNGDAVTAEGDPMALHYVTAVSDQLAGDYTIPVSELEKTRSATPAGAEVTSDDGATVLTFNPDGTFAFDFAAYGVHEEGTWSYENGVLTVTNPNGDAVTAEGDPMALHYVTAVSDQLAGDYTIPASLLAG